MTQNMMRLGNVAIDSSGIWTIVGGRNHSRNSVTSRREQFIHREMDDFEKQWNGDKYIMEVFHGTPVVGQRTPDTMQEVMSKASLEEGAHVIIGRAWLFRVLHHSSEDEVRCIGELIMQVEYDILRDVQLGNPTQAYRWDLQQRKRPALIYPEHLLCFSHAFLAAVGNMMLETPPDKVYKVPENFIWPMAYEIGGNWAIDTWNHTWYAVEFTKEPAGTAMVYVYRLRVVKVIDSNNSLRWNEDEENEQHVMHNGGMIFRLGPEGGDLVAYYCAGTQTFCEVRNDVVPWFMEVNHPPIIKRDIRTGLLTIPEFDLLRRLLAFTPSHPSLMFQIKAKTGDQIPQREEEPCGGVYGPDSWWSGRFKRMFQLRKTKYYQTSHITEPENMKRDGLRFVFVKNSEQYLWHILTYTGSFWRRVYRSKLYYLREEEDGTIKFIPVRNRVTGHHIERGWNYVLHRFPPGEPPHDLQMFTEGDPETIVILPDPDIDEDVFTSDSDSDYIPPPSAIASSKRRNSSYGYGVKK